LAINTGTQSKLIKKQMPGKAV